MMKIMMVPVNGMTKWPDRQQVDQLSGSELRGRTG